MEDYSNYPNLPLVSEMKTLLWIIGGQQQQCVYTQYIRVLRGRDQAAVARERQQEKDVSGGDRCGDVGLGHGGLLGGIGGEGIHQGEIKSTH